MLHTISSEGRCRPRSISVTAFERSAEYVCSAEEHLVAPQKKEREIVTMASETRNNVRPNDRLCLAAEFGWSTIKSASHGTGPDSCQTCNLNMVPFPKPGRATISK